MRVGKPSASAGRRGRCAAEPRPTLPARRRVQALRHRHCLKTVPPTPAQHERGSSIQRRTPRQGPSQAPDGEFRHFEGSEFRLPLCGGSGICTHGDGLRLNGFQDRHRPAGRAWEGDLKPAPPPPSCPESWASQRLATRAACSPRCCRLTASPSSQAPEGGHVSESTRHFEEALRGERFLHFSYRPVRFDPV